MQLHYATAIQLRYNDNTTKPQLQYNYNNAVIQL